MAYFKINNTDYSQYVNSLDISTKSNFTSQTNAAGDTVVDYIGKKREISVGIIPLNANDIKSLLADIEAFSVSISFLNPKTNELEEGVNCIIPSNAVSYYTIQADKVLTKAFSLTFTEL